MVCNFFFPTGIMQIYVNVRFKSNCIFSLWCCGHENYIRANRHVRVMSYGLTSFSFSRKASMVINVESFHFTVLFKTLQV